MVATDILHAILKPSKVFNKKINSKLTVNKLGWRTAALALHFIFKKI